LFSIAMAVTLGVLAALVLARQSAALIALPLLILIPALAIIIISLIHDPDHDPAYELVSATPTPAPALLFSRLTLALGLITLAALSGTLLLDLIGLSQFGVLVMAWLGPMLLLSGLTTTLLLLFRPLTAMGLSLALWTTVIIMLMAETSDSPIINASLAWMLDPVLWQFIAQLIAAAILWLFAWFLFSREVRPPTPLEEIR
jgi:hypothetical protein